MRTSPRKGRLIGDLSTTTSGRESSVQGQSLKALLCLGLYGDYHCQERSLLRCGEIGHTWYVETGEAAMNGVIDVCGIMRLVAILYGEE